MLPETHLTESADCGNVYFDFADSQPFTTFMNNPHASSTQWVQEQSTSSLFSTSPGHSIQSANYSSSSSPLADTTSFAEQLSLEKTDPCEEPAVTFSLYGDDPGFQQMTDALGVPVQTHLPPRDTPCYCGSGFPHIHHTYYPCCSQPVSIPVAEDAINTKTVTTGQSLPSVQTLTDPWSNNNNNYDQSTYDTAQGPLKRDLFIPTPAEQTNTQSFVVPGAPSSQSNISFSMTPSTYNTCGNPETMYYPATSSTLQLYESMECTQITDRPFNDQEMQSKHYISTRQNNSVSPKKDHSTKGRERYDSSRTKSDRSAQSLSTSSEHGRNQAEPRKSTILHDNASEPENTDPVVAAASAALANFHHRGSLQLWQFLVALLDDAKSQHLICWTGRTLEFKLNEPEEVARLWGIQKNRPAMNYDKLSRSLRYYYEKGIMQKVSGERYVYRFVYEPELLFALAFPGEDQGQLNRSEGSLVMDNLNVVSPPTDSSSSSKDWSGQQREEDKGRRSAPTENKSVGTTTHSVSERSMNTLNTLYPTSKDDVVRNSSDATIHYYHPVAPSYPHSVPTMYENCGTTEPTADPQSIGNTIAESNDHMTLTRTQEQGRISMELQNTSPQEASIFQSDGTWYSYLTDTHPSEGFSTSALTDTGSTNTMLNTAWTENTNLLIPMSPGHNRQSTQEAATWLDSWTTDSNRAMLHTPPVNSLFQSSELTEQSVVTLLSNEPETQTMDPKLGGHSQQNHFNDLAHLFVEENHTNGYPISWFQTPAMEHEFIEQAGWEVESRCHSGDLLGPQSSRCFYGHRTCTVLYSKQA